METMLAGPFGHQSKHILSVNVEDIIALYRVKAGIDVREDFIGIRELGLYECGLTGLKFWSPSSVAGSSSFYKKLSLEVESYYRVERWEYNYARNLLAELIGCWKWGAEWVGL